MAAPPRRGLLRRPHSAPGVQRAATPLRPRRRRRERSTLEPEVGGKAQADAPSGMMAFEDRDLDQVSRWVGDDAPIADGGLRYLNSRQELARYDPHDPDLPWPTWNAKRIACHRGEMNGLPHPFRHG